MNTAEVLRERERINNQYRADSVQIAQSNDTGTVDESNVIQLTENVVQEILDDMGIRSDTRTVGCTGVHDLLDCMLDPLGIMYQRIVLTDHVLKNRTELILAFRKNGTPVKLKPALFGYVAVESSSGKTNAVKMEDMDPEAYVIFRPLVQNGSALLSVFWTLLSFFSSRDVIPVVISSALLTGLGMISPRITTMILNRVIPAGAEYVNWLLVMILIMVGAGILRGIVSLAKSFYQSKTQKRVSFQLQSAVMAKALLAPDHFHFSSGSFSTMLRRAKNLSNTMVQQCFSTLIIACFSFGYITQMVSFSSVLVVPAVLVLLVRMAVAIVTSATSAENEKQVDASEAELNDFMFSTMSSIQKLRSRGMTPAILYAWVRAYSATVRKKMDPPWLTKHRDSIASLITAFSAAMILYVAVRENVSAENYYAFAAAYGLAVGVVDQICSSIHALSDINITLEELGELITSETTDPSEKEYVKKLQGEIELQNVSFRYPKARKYALDHMSLLIRPGEKVAFVGESGCGKSTLLKMLLGLLEPDNGLVLIDGTDTRHLNMRSVRKRIGSVFQFSKVLPDTIAANIRYAADKATEEDLWKAADQAAIGDDIRSMPMGLDTEVSESSSGGFSGGQRQRLLLARAFAAKPSVMILDEATSALDNISQEKVLESVYASDATVIMVAHRLSTIKGCDRIYALRNGRIEEQGTYEELVAKNGYFKELVKRQEV